MSEQSRTLPPEALDAWAAALRERFGLAPEDLNLDLGPLGPLLPRE